MLDKPDPSTISAAEAAHPPCTNIKVWLFGGLAVLIDERPAVVEMSGTFTANDIIAELARRCGSEFLDIVMEKPGVMSKNCRLFLDGFAVEDIHLPLQTQGNRGEWEMILLAADEGG
jgi:hypothetical protein